MTDGGRRDDRALRDRSTFVLLSGGESRRMGRDKAFLPVGGREMLDRLLEVGRSACSGCVLAVDDVPTYAEALVRYGWEEAPGEGRFRRGGVPLRLVTDRHPGEGPVAGLEAGLDAAAGPLCFVAACDLPFLETAVVRGLLRELDAFRPGGDAPEARAVVPVVGSRRQPLAAAYAAAVAPAARRCVEAGELRMDDLLRRLEVRTVPAGEVVPDGSGNRRRPFTNVNRPEDLRAARRDARGEDPEGRRAAPVRVLCVSGDSGSGKTALVRRLLPRLARPRDAIAVVKHTHHAIDWHPAGKDSGELWDAGPAALAVAGPDQTARFERVGRADAEADAAGAGGGTKSGAADAAEAATRRLVRVCGRLPPRVRLVLAEGFSDARAPTLWTAAGPPGAGPLPPEVVAVVVPAELREPWVERHDGTEVFSREEADAVAARVEEWAAPVGELPRG